MKLRETFGVVLVSAGVSAVITTLAVMFIAIVFGSFGPVSGSDIKFASGLCICSSILVVVGLALLGVFEE